MPLSYLIKSDHKKAFTLVEVIVVMGIVGILASLSVYGLGTMRAKSRDSVRKSDMAKIKLGMQNFYGQFKTYPNPSMNNDAKTGIEDGSDAGRQDEGFKCSDANNKTITGFMSVNSCLHYLGYSELVNQDVKAPTDITFRYRYATILGTDYQPYYEISTRLEIGGNLVKSDCKSGLYDDDRYEISNDATKVDTSGTGYMYTISTETYTQSTE